MEDTPLGTVRPSGRHRLGDCGTQWRTRPLEGGPVEDSWIQTLLGLGCAADCQVCSLLTPMLPSRLPTHRRLKAI